MYSIEIEDVAIEKVTKISENTVVFGDRIKTTEVYILENGMKVTDTLVRGNIIMRSPEGTDYVTRTRELEEWGSITLTARFKWRTEGLFSYVECTYAKATKNLEDFVEMTTWDVSKTQGEIAIGNAHAQVSYKGHSSINPLFWSSGTFRIICNDEGSISDNG